MSAQFVIDLTIEHPDELSCPICQDVISDGELAHVGCPCRFCFGCIHVWTNHVSTCPTCRAPVTRIERLGGRIPQQDDDVIFLSLPVKRKTPDVAMWAHTIE